jgi:hypothetical protein
VSALCRGSPDCTAAERRRLITAARLIIRRLSGSLLHVASLGDAKPSPLDYRCIISVIMSLSFIAAVFGFWRPQGSLKLAPRRGSLKNAPRRGSSTMAPQAACPETHLFKILSGNRFCPLLN